MGAGMHRWIAVGGAALALGLAAGCGDDGPSQADSSAPTSAATSPSETPAEQAKLILQTVYGTQLAAWTARYADEWGRSPATTYAAERKNDADWTATFVLTGPDEQRVEAEWTLVDTPLDEPWTSRDLDDGKVGYAVEPANAHAKRFAKLPLAEPAAGPTSVVLTVREIGRSGRELTVTIDGTAPVPTDLLIVDARIDDALLRGANLIEQRFSSGRSEVRVDSATVYLRQDGSRLPRDEFASLVSSAGRTGLEGVIFSWPAAGDATDIDALLKQPAQRVQVLTA